MLPTKSLMTFWDMIWYLRNCEKGLNNRLSLRFLPGTSTIVSRARYTEDTLVEAIRHGVKQYVILGAGMDAFAFRRSDLMEQLRVFEVDHPTTQEYKLRRFAELGWKYTENLHFIPIDFTNT
jgi:methyltransferase (TIGR00027 family)